MYDKTEFLVQLKRARLTQEELSKKMGIAVSTLNQKIKTGNFKRNEMAELITVLHIDSPARFYEIFFSHNLREMQD